MITTKKILNKLNKNDQLKIQLSENDLSIILDELQIYETELSTQNKEPEDKSLDYSQAYLDNIFINSPNIEIVTNGEQIDKANQVMLDFVGYESVY